LKRYHPIKINNKVIRIIVIKKKRSAASLKKIHTENNPSKCKQNINNKVTKTHKQKWSKSINTINKEAINEKNIDKNISPKMKTRTICMKLIISQDTKNHPTIAITKEDSRLPTSTKDKAAITN